MKSSEAPRSLIRTSQLNLSEEQAFAHPLNPKSEVRGVSLSELAGMERLGIHLVRVAAGKEAFIYHTHSTEEEFVFILSGRAMAEIGDEEIEVGPGDFMGFPTPSVAHHIKNPFDEDLVYLMGGERQDLEVADFPRIKKRIIRMKNEAHLVDHDHLQPFWRREDAED